MIKETEEEEMIALYRIKPKEEEQRKAMQP